MMSDDHRIPRGASGRPELHPTPPDLLRVCVVGSSTHFLSGISYYTTYLVTALQPHADVSAVLMRKLLPRRFYPGRSRVGTSLTSMSVSELVPTYDGVDWYLFPSLIRAWQFVRSRHSDVLVLQWWTAAVLPQYLFLACHARRNGKAIVVEVHEDQDSGEQQVPMAARIGRWGLHRLTRASSACIVHSAWDRERLAERLGLPVDRVHVIPHGPYDVHARSEDVTAGPGGNSRSACDKRCGSVPRTEPGVSDSNASSGAWQKPAVVQPQTPDRGWPPGRKLAAQIVDTDIRAICTRNIRLLFFGVIRPYKGLEDLIEAFSLLPRDARRSWHLSIVGETWEGWTLPLERLEQSPYRNEVHVVNRYVTDQEASAVFARADMVVLPYHRSSASGPLHMAMGAGLPVVATGVGGLVEALGNYSGGVIAEPKNPTSLAAAIVEAAALVGTRHVEPVDWTEIGARYSQILRRVSGNVDRPAVPGSIDSLSNRPGGHAVAGVGDYGHGDK